MDFRQWIDDHPRPLMIFAGAIVVAAIVTLMLILTSTTNHAVNRADQSIVVGRQAAEHECNRVNVLRQQSDLTAGIAYQALAGAVVNYKSALKHPTPGSVKRLHLAINTVTHEISQLTVTGITRCDLASEYPATYLPPNPIPVGDPYKSMTVSPAAAKILKVANSIIHSKSPLAAMAVYDHSHQ